MKVYEFRPLVEKLGQLKVASEKEWVEAMITPHLCIMDFNFGPEFDDNKAIFNEAGVRMLFCDGILADTACLQWCEEPEPQSEDMNDIFCSHCGRMKTRMEYLKMSNIRFRVSCLIGDRQLCLNHTTQIA